MNKLAEVLARTPHLGWERDAVCVAVNEDRRTVSNVILKAQRGVDMRKHTLNQIWAERLRNPWLDQ